MVKHNLIANYLGHGWVALMGLAFVPLYIKYLGIEAYGLIGLFSVMQAWFILLDMGMTPTISREMGRFSGGTHTSDSIRDLLRSVELLALAIAVLLALGIFSISDWLAVNWLQPESISESSTANAFAIMGVVAALRFLEGVYRSCLIGLQKQVLYNLINSALATVRAIGAVVILLMYSATIEAFFIWQGAVSLFSLLMMVFFTYRILPNSGRRAHFSHIALRKIGRYAGGMFGISFLTLLLTQIDKVLLSRLVPLVDYGYYTLAFVVAGVLYLFLAPIVQAWFPKLSQLHAEQNIGEFTDAYHQGAQLVSIILGSAALVLIIHSEAIIQLWTQDTELATKTAPLVRWLTLGNLLNGLMTMPYQAQLAYGWTGYALRVNLISVLVIVPAILWAVPKFGAEGAAIVWVCLNSLYLLVAVHYMYSRILINEKWRWYWEDLMQPMIPAITVASLVYFLVPTVDSQGAQVLIILLSGLMILISSVYGAPKIALQVKAFACKRVREVSQRGA